MEEMPSILAKEIFSDEDCMEIIIATRAAARIFEISERVAGRLDDRMKNIMMNESVMQIVLFVNEEISKKYKEKFDKLNKKLEENYG